MKTLQRLSLYFATPSFVSKMLQRLSLHFATPSFVKRALNILTGFEYAFENFDWMLKLIGVDLICICYYCFNSHNDVPQVAQRNVSIVADTRTKVRPCLHMQYGIILIEVS